MIDNILSVIAQEFPDFEIQEYSFNGHNVNSETEEYPNELHINVKMVPITKK